MTFHLNWKDAHSNFGGAAESHTSGEIIHALPESGL